MTSDRGRVSPKVETSGRVRYYDYGKTAIRPGRKMGHLTIAGVPSERVECTKALEAAHEKWIAEVMTR